LPPDGFGSESDHLEIFNITLFVIGEDREETKFPPLYTRPGDIDAAESVSWQLYESAGPYMNAGRDSFRVYSVDSRAPNSGKGVPSAVIMNPIFLAEDELIDDALEFTEGISRGFH
jgi:hypothetical protein